MKTIQGRLRAAVLMGSALAFAVEVLAQNPNNNTWPYATGSLFSAPVLAVVGDIACQPGEAEPSGEKSGENCGSPKSPYTPTSLWQSQEATADQIEAMQPAAVALLGDLQYQV